jgi:hypothetical protein
MATSGGNPLMHPIKYWRVVLIGFGCSFSMVYGYQPVADAAGNQAFANVFIALMAALMGYGNFYATRWTNRRHP